MNLLPNLKHGKPTFENSCFVYPSLNKNHFQVTEFPLNFVWPQLRLPTALRIARISMSAEF